MTPRPTQSDLCEKCRPICERCLSRREEQVLHDLIEGMDEASAILEIRRLIKMAREDKA